MSLNSSEMGLSSLAFELLTFSSRNSCQGWPTHGLPAVRGREGGNRNAVCGKPNSHWRVTQCSWLELNDGLGWIDGFGSERRGQEEERGSPTAHPDRCDDWEALMTLGFRGRNGSIMYINNTA